MNNITITEYEARKKDPELKLGDLYDTEIGVCIVCIDLIKYSDDNKAFFALKNGCRYGSPKQCIQAIKDGNAKKLSSGTVVSIEVP